MTTKRIKKSDVSKVTKAVVAGHKSDPGLQIEAEPVVLSAAEGQSRDDIRLGFLIHDVSRMRRSAYDHFMKPLDITRAQWWVLAHLSRHDGMMQTQLADVLEVGKASLGDVIESLESGGWVTRRPDPTDKRAKRVYLNKPAQTLIKRMTVMENQFNARVLTELSHEERSLLVASLLKIKNAIARFSPEDGDEA